MKRVRRFLHRLLASITRSDREEFAAELEAHLTLLTEENIRRGLSPDAARREALLRLGGTSQIAETRHDQRTLPLVDTLPSDLRLAARRLRHEPRLAIVCIMTLAIAIGASTIIFSAVNAALIRPLPYPDADRLVRVWETNPQAERWGDWASYPDFDDWSREARLLDGLALFRSGRLIMTAGEFPETLVAERVSPSLFSVLRVDPLLGRRFLANEGMPGGTDVAILSHRLWERQFGSDPGVVGQLVPFDGRPHLVVGVMPRSFDFPATLQPAAEPPDVWIPVIPDTDRGSHNYSVIGRLKVGQTVTQARLDLERVMRTIASLDAGHAGRGAGVEGLQQHTVSAVRPALLLLMGAVGLVIVISCANVAVLLLARGAARRREIALRRAIGATSGRLLQQSVVEGLVLAVAGGICGVVIAQIGIGVLAKQAPAIPLVQGANLDVRVLAFALVATLVTGVVFGLVPTLQALRVPANDALKEGGTRQAGSSRISATRTLLTIGEVALALVLLIGAALFLRSFTNVTSVQAGFDSAGVVTASLTAPPEDAKDPSRTAQFFQRVSAAIAAVPGVRAIAVSSAVPLISNESSPFRVEGVEYASRQEFPYAEQPKVTDSYFEAMNIRLLRGRRFAGSDVVGGEPVAIVSQGLAARYWPGGEALGKRVAITDRTWRRIVGIVDDVRNDGLETSARPTIYIPFAQFPRASASLVVQTSRDDSAVITAVRRAVRDITPSQPLYRIQTMDEVLGKSVALRRFLMLLIGSLAGVAVVLGIVGVYGVLAYLIGQRRPELAIRIALGAARTEIVWLVAKRGVILGVAGVTLGLAASVTLSTLLEGSLFGVSPVDSGTYLFASTLLLLVVVAVSSLPAWRATYIPAAEALRTD